MAAVVPPRPVAGETIASPWGQDMHDRQYSPICCIATGLSTVPAGGGAVDINTIAAGTACTLVAAEDAIQIKANFNGVYIITAFGFAGPASLTSNPYHMFTFQLNGITQPMGIAVPGHASTAMRWAMSGVFRLSEADKLKILTSLSVTCQLQRLAIFRIGNAYG